LQIILQNYKNRIIQYNHIIADCTASTNIAKELPEEDLLSSFQQSEGHFPPHLHNQVLRKIGQPIRLLSQQHQWRPGSIQYFQRELMMMLFTSFLTNDKKAFYLRKSLEDQPQRSNDE
jgi:hypothetical protein